MSVGAAIAPAFEFKLAVAITDTIEKSVRKGWRRPPDRQTTTAAVKMTTTATPRRRDRAPLSSVDSNVVGSLRKKNATSR